MEKRDEQNAWHLFELSGKINDYLSYKNIQAASQTDASEEGQHASKDKRADSKGSEYR